MRGDEIVVVAIVVVVVAAGTAVAVDVAIVAAVPTAEIGEAAIDVRAVETDAALVEAIAVELEVGSV